jgi:phosphatidate cytidylyltransferase
MLKERVLTALVLVAVLLAFLFSPALWTLGFFALVLVLAAWEWAGLAGLSSNVRAGYALLLGVGIACLFLGLVKQGQVNAEAVRAILGVACAGWAILLLWVKTYPGSAAIWGGSVMRSCLGVLVLLPVWVALIYLRFQESGSWLILYVILLVACADTGAYFTGRAFGKHKLAPQVSPGKTIEGALGGLALVCVFATVVSVTLLPAGLPVVSFLIVSLFAALASVLGDLVESMVKRHQGVKDSGTLLPGHGGVMDRVDSLTAAIPVFTFGLVTMHLQ